PSNTVRTVVSQLISTGKAEHAYLGVSIETPASGSGARIAVLRTSDTPAAKAGLRAGDVITALDGSAISSPDELQRAVADHRPASRGSAGTLGRGVLMKDWVKLVMALFALVLVGTSIAAAKSSAPRESKKVSVCVNRRTGVMRFAKKCRRKRERRVVWLVQGAK